MEETPQGRVFLTVYVPAAAARHHRRGAYQPGAGADGASLLGYDVTIVDPRTAFATPERFPDVKVIAEWPDKAMPPLGIDRYTAFVALTHDPKIDDPALAARAGARLLLYRRARLAEDACPARRAAEGSRASPTPRSRPHPRADRARHRRGVAGGDRGRDHGADHRAAARRSRRRRSACRGGVMKFGAVAPEGGARRHCGAHHPAAARWCSRRAR